MTNLWCALALLAREKELRVAVAAVAAEGLIYVPRLEVGLEDADKTLKDLHLSISADKEALRAIDSLFRSYGLFLSPFVLSEINRWMHVGQPILDALTTFSQAAESAFEAGGPVHSNAFLAALGALVSDQNCRKRFTGELVPLFKLAENGFDVTPDEEQALLAEIKKDAVKSAADEIFNLGWSGTACSSIAVWNDNYIHFNH